MALQHTKPFLSNANFEIEASEDRKFVFLEDFTDQNNRPSAYSESVRGLKEALADIEASFSDAMTFGQAMEALKARGVKMHFWCAMD